MACFFVLTRAVWRWEGIEEVESMKADYRGMHNGAITDPALKKSGAKESAMHSAGHAKSNSQKSSNTGTVNRSNSLMSR